MAIYGIGAYYDRDVSMVFIKNKIVGTGWNIEIAPELHEYIRSIKVGDIVYIKSFSPNDSQMTIKAIGIIKDAQILGPINLNGVDIEIGRNVIWISKKYIKVKKPEEKNNVRNNTIYEEFHPIIQKRIMNTLKGIIDKKLL